MISASVSTSYSDYVEKESFEQRYRHQHAGGIAGLSVLIIALCCKSRSDGRLNVIPFLSNCNFLGLPDQQFRPAISDTEKVGKIR